VVFAYFTISLEIVKYAKTTNGLREICKYFDFFKDVHTKGVDIIQGFQFLKKIYTVRYRHRCTDGSWAIDFPSKSLDNPLAPCVETHSVQEEWAGGCPHSNSSAINQYLACKNISIQSTFLTNPVRLINLTCTSWKINGGMWLKLHG